MGEDPAERALPGMNQSAVLDGFRGLRCPQQQFLPARASERRELQETALNKDVSSALSTVPVRPAAGLQFLQCTPAVSSLQDPTPDDRGEAAVAITEIKSTVSITRVNHPQTTSPLGPDHGKLVFHEIGPWCGKAWTPLI